MRLFYVSWAVVSLATLFVVFAHSLPSLSGSKTQCDFSFWTGNQSIEWCTAGPPNVTIQAMNYTGGCNNLGPEGGGGIRLWVDLKKGRVQEMVGFLADDCSLDKPPMFFLAEPMLKLGHCGVVCMFVMLYPIGSMRVNCSTTVS